MLPIAVAARLDHRDYCEGEFVQRKGTSESSIGPLYRLMKNGVVKAHQFNRVWMIDRQEVERIKALQGPGGGLSKSKRE